MRGLSVRAARGRGDVRGGGARSSPRAGRRGLRVVLKGTAPDSSHRAGAEARTKRGGEEEARARVLPSSPESGLPVPVPWPTEPEAICLSPEVILPWSFYLTLPRH